MSHSESLHISVALLVSQCCSGLSFAFLRFRITYMHGTTRTWGSTSLSPRSWESKLMGGMSAWCPGPMRMRVRANEWPNTPKPPVPPVSPSFASSRFRFLTASPHPAIRVDKHCAMDISQRRPGALSNLATVARQTDGHCRVARAAVRHVWRTSRWLSPGPAWPAQRHCGAAAQVQRRTQHARTGDQGSQDPVVRCPPGPGHQRDIAVCT